MKHITILLAVLIVGCSSKPAGEIWWNMDWTAAEKACKEHGGVNHATKSNELDLSRYVTAYCYDHSIIDHTPILPKIDCKDKPKNEC
jgi:hypothetical protein